MTDRICNGRTASAPGGASVRSTAARFGRTLALVATFAVSAGTQAFEVDFNLEARDADNDEATSDVSFDFGRALSGDNTLRSSGRSISPSYAAALGSANRGTAARNAGRYARGSIVALPNRRVGGGAPDEANAVPNSRSGSQCWYHTGTGAVRICAAAFGTDTLSRGVRVSSSALLVEQAPRFALASFSALGDRKVGPDGSTPANSLPQRIAMGMFMDRADLAEVREPGTLGLVALLLIGLYAAHRRGLIGGRARTVALET